jgi:CRISPR-associated protein Cmr4
MTEDFEPKTYYAIALDPIHVGTGGYRLGRVDNAIVREPGTNLPKIPGTSLCGATRTYLAMQTSVATNDGGKRSCYRWNTGKKDKEGQSIYSSCAGQGPEIKGRPHCGEAACPVCTTFGFSTGAQSFAGLANFSDLHILLFPVATMQGPVWVTSPGQLSRNGDEQKLSTVSDNKVKLSEGLNSHINLGWLLLHKDNKNEDNIAELISSLDESIPGEVKKRIVLVSDKLFGQVVNTNLEVRTSVAIDPATGAAEDGALFTYEAIPRGTVFCFDLVCQNPEHYRVGGKKITAFDSNNTNDINSVRKAVEKGFGYLAYLGIGGMNSRGMGRMKILNIGGSNDGS